MTKPTTAFLRLPTAAALITLSGAPPAHAADAPPAPDPDQEIALTLEAAPPAVGAKAGV